MGKITFLGLEDASQTWCIPATTALLQRWTPLPQFWGALRFSLHFHHTSKWCHFADPRIETTSFGDILTWFKFPACLLWVASLSAIVTLHSFVDLLSLPHFWKAHLPKHQSPGSSGFCQGLIAPALIHQYDYDCPKDGPNWFNENLPGVVVLVTMSIGQSLLAAKPWEAGAHCHQRELTSKGTQREEKQIWSVWFPVSKSSQDGAALLPFSS